MPAKVLGISGSPRIGQTTDQLIYEVLRASHSQYEFVSLANKKILSCSSCLKCKDDNICKIVDDWKPISEQMLNSPVLVLGAPNYFGRMNALTHIFLERFYSLLHQGYISTKGKYGVIVAVAGEDPSAVEKDMKSFFDEIGIIHLGSIKAYGESNCHVCAFGSTCKVGIVVRKYSKGIKVNPETMSCLEKQPEVLKKIREIGELINNTIGTGKK